MERLDRPGSLPAFEDFSKCRGGRFVVTVAQGVVELITIEVSALPVRSHFSRPFPCSVLFLGPKDRRLS
jgi:hypothetical protein